MATQRETVQDTILHAQQQLQTIMDMRGELANNLSDLWLLVEQLSARLGDDNGALQALRADLSLDNKHLNAMELERSEDWLDALRESLKP